MTKKIFSLSMIMLGCMLSFAQKKTFDVVSYNLPKGWQQQEVEAGVQLSATDKKTGEYALVIIVRSTITQAAANENFKTQWEKLVKGGVKVSEAPTMLAPRKDKGWDIIAGWANYTDGNNKAVVTQITATGGGKMISAIAMHNAQKYEAEVQQFLNSLTLTQSARSEAAATKPIHASADNSVIVGTWSQSSSAGMYGQSLTSGYTTMQYTFNSNGTYQYIAKTFSQSLAYIILSKESGKYSITGNKLTIAPVEGATQSWTKNPAQPISPISCSNLKSGRLKV